MFKLFFRKKAFKILKAIERKHQLRINSALNELKKGQFDKYNIEKIKGTDKGYRLRIGRWRILFILISREKRIEIVDIFLKKGKGDYFKKKKLIR